MREIKFQAWDLDAQQMYNWESIKQLFHEHLDHPRVKVRQYTGLKDKKGREIYEGDVVKGINFNMTRPQRFIGEVEYSYNGYTVKGVKQYTGLRSELNINFEVIGDVYRNPDLLEAAE